MLFLCFEQHPSNVTWNLQLQWFNTGARLSLDAAGGLILSSDNASDFHAKIWSLLAIFS